MIEAIHQAVAVGASPEARAEILQRELELARKLCRAGLLLVVSSSDSSVGRCQLALERSLRSLGQAVQHLHVEDLTADRLAEALAQAMDVERTVLWIDDLRWNHGRPADLWNALNGPMLALLGHRVRAVFWLTPRDAIDLAHYAPDLWAKCQRVIELGSTSSDGHRLEEAVATAWDAWQPTAPEIPDAAANGAVDSSPASVAEWNEQGERRAGLLLTQGILNWRKGEHAQAVESLTAALHAAQAAQDRWTEAEVFNALALVHSGAGRINEAIDAYRQAIRLAPGPIPAWNNLGNLLAKVSRNEDAAQAFLKALQTNPRDPIAWIGLGNVHLGKGELDHAAAAYRKSTRYMPDFAQAWNGLGDAYAAAGRIDDALEAYRKAIEIDPKYITPRLRLGSLYGRQQRYREAYSEYQDALALDSRNQAAWDEFGVICLESERFEEAAAAFSKSIELGGGDGTAYGNMAIALARQGRYKEAVPLYQKSIQLLPGDRSTAWKRLADAYRMLDEYEKAARAYHMAEHGDYAELSAQQPQDGALFTAVATDGGDAEVPPASAPPLGHVADVLPQSVEESRIAPQQSTQAAAPRAGQRSPLSLSRSAAESWNARGNALFRDGALRDAVDAYKKAVETDPTFGWPYANLALTSVAAGELPEALLLFEKSLEYLDNDAERAVAWNGIGNVQRRLDDYPKALVAYQKAAELDPQTAGMRDRADGRPPFAETKSADGWNDLGEALLGAGALDEAVRAFRNAIELQPENGLAYCNLAGVLAALGQHARAVPFYQSAIERLGDGKAQALALNGLGDVYRRLGEVEKANDAYGRARTLDGEDNTVLNRARLSLLGNRPRTGKIAVLHHDGGSDE